MATQGGAGRCTTAPGTAAAIATSARSASNTGQTASKPTCAALSLRKDTPTARSPATVATPARGTTPRFATTPIVESWLKWVRVIGSTASCAAALTPIARRGAEREDCRGEQREVEAGHREDVIAAGAAEALVELVRQVGPLAEQEPRQQRPGGGRQPP